MREELPRKNFSPPPSARVRPEDLVLQLGEEVAVSEPEPQSPF